MVYSIYFSAFLLDGWLPFILSNLCQVGYGTSQCDVTESSANHKLPWSLNRLHASSLIPMSLILMQRKKLRYIHQLGPISHYHARSIQQWLMFASIGQPRKSVQYYVYD